jgi:cell wall-associated NlpC family hydrolase
MICRAGRAARIAALGAAIALASAPPADAQGVSVALGRLFTEDARSVFRFDVGRPVAGPLGVTLHGTAVTSPAGASRPLWGAGADLTLFQNGRPGFYAVAGLDGGFGFDDAETLWGSWSAGLGYEYFPFDVLVVGLEGRWRELAPTTQSGAELSLRFGARFGRARTPAPARPGVRLPPPGAPSASDLPGADEYASTAAAALTAIVATAEDAIGTRYRLGGTGEGDGFDCSGLIQYAYAQEGIDLPRRSVDQARAGREIGRDAARLRPGDILTFAQSGTRVSHVGLYVGDGRFIHSASRGVRVSVLDENNPDGRYWMRRWVGSRRILE